MSDGMIRAVLFDRDNTVAVTDKGRYLEAARWLADTYGMAEQQALETLVTLWQERADDWWPLRNEADETAFWEAYGWELTARLGLPREAAAAILQAYPYERYMVQAPHAREVLSELRRRGLKIGVLSNTLPSIDRTLTELGIGDLVDVALATCVLGVHKPQPEAFEWALRELGLPATEVLFVDDLPENVAAARALGMPAHQIDLTGRTPGALHALTDVLGLV